MAKKKYVLLIILIAAVIIGAVVYLLFLQDRPESLDEPAELTLWYSQSSPLSENLEFLTEKYNTELSPRSKVTVTLCPYESEMAIMNAVSEAKENSGELPDMIMCDADVSAWLSKARLLADTENYQRNWDTELCDKAMMKSCTVSGKLVSMPVAAEYDVLVVNTKLYPDIESIDSFEALCESANAYYMENKQYFFTLTDYAAFFRTAMAQLDERFEAENPFEDEDEDVRYIYDHLATSAFKRGFTAAKGDPVRMVAEGKLVCALVPAGTVMAAAKNYDVSSLGIMPCPPMKNGDSVYVPHVTGVSVLKSDENSLMGASIFISWLLSEENNAVLVGKSGLVSAKGGVLVFDSAPELYYELMAMFSGMESRVYHANSDYPLKSYEFNSIIDNIMKKSLS